MQVITLVLLQVIHLSFQHLLYHRAKFFGKTFPLLYFLKFDHVI